MKIRQTVGAAVFSTGLVLSLASFAGATSGQIGTTGPWSNNQITSTLSNNAVLTNNNNLGVANNNTQHAYSGDAKVFYNTTAGGAATGSVSNFNQQNVSASVSNNSGVGAGLAGWGAAGGSSVASINLTGPQSNNQIFDTQTNNLVVTNNNNLSVTNNNSQSASSGDAKVFGNTTGGSAITGNASNSNTSSVNLNVSN